MTDQPSLPASDLPPGTVGRAGPGPSPQPRRRGDGGVVALPPPVGGPVEGLVDKDGCLVYPWHGPEVRPRQREDGRGPQGVLTYVGKTPGYTQLAQAYGRVLVLRRRRVEQPVAGSARRVEATRARPVGPRRRVQRTEADGRSAMATRDSGGQDRASKGSEEVEEVQAEETSDVQERVDKLTDDVDALLDEIDDVLEENAEDSSEATYRKGGESRLLDRTNAQKQCPTVGSISRSKQFSPKQATRRHGVYCSPCSPSDHAELPRAREQRRHDVP